MITLKQVALQMHYERENRLSEKKLVPVSYLVILRQSWLEYGCLEITAAQRVKI